MKTSVCKPVWSGRLVISTLATSAALGSFAASPVYARTQADPSAYTLKKRAFKTGDINRYKFTVKIHIAEMDTVIRMLFKETTKEAKPDGEFTLLNQFESAVVTAAGTEQDISTFLPTITVIRDKDGKLSNKTEGGNEQAAAQMSTMIQSLSTAQDAYVPKGPVKVGDKWKVSVSMPGPTGGTNKSEGEATLVGIEAVDGVKSLKIMITSDVDNKEAGLKARSESTMNIDPDNGKLLKMTAKADGTVGGMKMTQDIEMVLAPQDKK